jgi:quercetin dioxygenase-like cupin family protein
MPYVAPEEAPIRPFPDLDRLIDESGPPPWRIPLVGTPQARVVLIHWPAGYEAAAHVHPHALEAFQVIRGRARFAIGDHPEHEVGVGGIAVAHPGVPHAIRVPTDASLVLLATVSPNEDRPDEQVELPAR